MMSYCKNSFNYVLFPKHLKVLAFVILVSFSLTGAKTLEIMGLLSSWCAYIALQHLISPTKNQESFKCLFSSDNVVLRVRAFHGLSENYQTSEGFALT